MLNRLLLMCLLLLTSLASRAQEVGQDSLERAALSPDFIRVSLLVVSPGSKVYEAYGHVALRMECPSAELDYCFTFEMALTPTEQLRFLIGTAKAGFIATSTKQFQEQYKAVGRGVTAYQLNLLPQEKQQLWRLLDEEMGRGAHWNFDVTENTCTSMTAWIVDRSLSIGKIVFHDLDPVFEQGTYRDVVDLCSEQAPWSGLFWKTRIGRKGWNHPTIDKKMMPVLMGDAWQKATIDDDEGNSRTLVIGASETLVKQTMKPVSPLITPSLVLTVVIFLLLLLLFILILKRHHKKKNQYKK